MRLHQNKCNDKLEHSLWQARRDSLSFWPTLEDVGLSTGKVKRDDNVTKWPMRQDWRVQQMDSHKVHKTSCCWFACRSSGSTQDKFQFHSSEKLKERDDV